MKAMAISEPNRITEILKSAPQLSYAIFQALILMNLVDPKILAQVVEQATQQNPTPMQHQQPPPPQQYQGYPPPPQAMPGMPPRPPPQTYAQPPPAAPLSNEQLLQQVLAMDQRTVDSLPPAERAQIMQLRQQMGVR